MIAAARQSAEVGPSPDATEHDPDHARGAAVSGINVHAIRLAGLEAHQEVLMGSPGQQFILRHDAFDRSSYMPGVLLGLRTVASRPGLSYGLDAYLGRSEEHTSELQSRGHRVCRLLLEKKQHRMRR